MLTYVYSIKHHSRHYQRRLWEHGFGTYEKVITGVAELDDLVTRVHLDEIIKSENQINL